MKSFIVRLVVFFFLPVSIYAQEAEKPEITAYIKNNQVIVEYKIPKGFHQMAENKDFFGFKVSPSEHITFSKIIYPDTAVKGQYGSEYHGSTKLIRTFKVTGKISDPELSISANYQLCNDKGVCFMPETQEISLLMPGKYLTPSESSKPPEAVNNREKRDDKASQAFSSGSDSPNIGFLLKMVLFAFIGGIILNLMPCVLPVLSIKMLSIVNSANMNRREILRNSFAYTFGILVSFFVLAVVIIYLKKSAELVGWGFQFQNPYFIFFLLVIIWGFALSLFDVYMISVPGMSSASALSSGHGLTGTFMSGVFAVLLATPCTAPLLGTAIGFALQQSPLVIITIMLTIGLGLAFPFLILGFFPSFMKMIPKPGDWMNIFRSVMGFFLLATAVFLGRSLFYLVSSRQFFNIVWFMLILSFALWLYGITSNPLRNKKIRVSGLIITFALMIGSGIFFVDLSADQAGEQISNSKVESAGNKNWKTFSPELFSELKKEGKKVFLIFSAEWCMTCKFNEKNVFATDEIKEAFRKNGITVLYGDFTRKNKVILEFLQKNGRAGVPFYMYVDEKNNKKVLFPEIISKKMILDAI